MSARLNCASNIALATATIAFATTTIVAAIAVSKFLNIFLIVIAMYPPSSTHKVGTGEIRNQFMGGFFV